MISNHVIWRLINEQTNKVKKCGGKKKTTGAEKNKELVGGER